MLFETFNLHEVLFSNVIAAGYEKPTPIQAATIPLALEQRDLIATAQTGTGKTAAYLLPTLHRLMNNVPGKGKGPRALILAPTRELATQVKKAVDVYSKGFRKLNTVTILGGTSYSIQNSQLRNFVDILVATPGRLIDQMKQGNIDFSRLEIVILDEADRMLDMGFYDDVEYIVESTPAQRQTLLFSATFDKKVAQLAHKLLNNPERIDIVPAKAQHNQIEQQLHYVNTQTNKKAVLLELMNSANIGQAIVFTSTKRGADDLAEEIKELGYSVSALHGDMRQRVRNRTLELLRKGQIQYLIATDVAARGIDISTISHVFNFDLPRAVEDYVHRIGRTGRAGSFGTAISIATFKEKSTVRQIEKYLGHQIPVVASTGQEENRSERRHKSNDSSNYTRDNASSKGRREFNSDASFAGRDGKRSDSRHKSTGNPNYSRDNASSQGRRESYSATSGTGQEEKRFGHRNKPTGNPNYSRDNGSSQGRRESYSATSGTGQEEKRFGNRNKSFGNPNYSRDNGSSHGRRESYSATSGTGQEEKRFGNREKPMGNTSYARDNASSHGRREYYSATSATGQEEKRFGNRHKPTGNPSYGRDNASSQGRRESYSATSATGQEEKRFGNRHKPTGNPSYGRDNASSTGKREHSYDSSSSSRKGSFGQEGYKKSFHDNKPTGNRNGNFNKKPINRVKN